jgi:hypothetical protein
MCDDQAGALQRRRRDARSEPPVAHRSQSSLCVLGDLRGRFTCDSPGLLDELRAFGYTGTYKAVGKDRVPLAVRQRGFERTANDVTIPAPPPPVLTDPAQRQISPHIAATLLTIPRPDLKAVEGRFDLSAPVASVRSPFALVHPYSFGDQANLKRSASPVIYHPG